MVHPTASEFADPLNSMTMMVDRFNPVPEGSRSETSVHNASTPVPCDEITPSDSISCVEVAQRSENRVVEGRKITKIFFEKL